MFDRDHDARVRAAAFDWLTRQVDEHGDVLPRSLLAEGFTFGGVRVPLISPQGIFKPKVFDEVPLSITTTPNSPYKDVVGPDGLLRYCYRGTDPNHQDNRGLRLAMQRELPLAYFHGVIEGRYVPSWPVFIVQEERESHRFAVAVDDAQHVHLDLGTSAAQADPASDAIRRAYVTAEVRVRLHQRAFRERVIEAYRRQCAFCQLRHEELLDAAHIVPDRDPAGEPRIANGLALCALHHAAFDRFFVGLRPDLVIEVRPDLLREKDGPTLVHAIQRLHGTRIALPRAPVHYPDLELVERRYQRFSESAAGSLTI